MNFSNTTTRRVSRRAPIADERVARQAIFLRIGFGPTKTAPGYDDPAEAAQALAKLSNSALEPTIVLATHDGVSATWVFDQPVPPAKFEQLARALCRAGMAHGVRFEACVGEVVTSDMKTPKEMTAALSAWLPETYARAER